MGYFGVFPENRVFGGIWAIPGQEGSGGVHDMPQSLVPWIRGMAPIYPIWPKYPKIAKIALFLTQTGDYTPFEPLKWPIWALFGPLK